MTHDQRMRGIERIKRLRVPERFRDYRVALVEMPEHPMYDVIYDMPMRTIWVNAAAEPGANVSRIETGKW